MADGVGAAAGAGALSGAATGASLGAMAGPYGALIGGAIGAVAGGVSGGMKKKKANEAQEIPMVDAMEQQRLSELEQQRKSLMAGTDGITQNQISEIRNAGAATQNAITKNTGGDVAGTMDALLRANKGTQQGVNNAVAQAQGRLPYFDSASGNLLSRIAQRKLELQLLKRSQATAEAAQNQTDNNVNMNAAIGSGILSSNEMINSLNKSQQLGNTTTSAMPVQGVPVMGQTTNLTPDYATPIITNYPSVPLI